MFFFPWIDICAIQINKFYIIIIIVSIITVFGGVLFVLQPGANHAPRASVTQVNHSVHTLSTFLSTFIINIIIILFYFSTFYRAFTEYPAVGRLPINQTPATEKKATFP